MTTDVVGAIAKSLKLALLIKILSFLINVLVVRFSSILDFGKISVNFHLVVSVSLFVLKEGFRRSALRDADPANAVCVIFQGIAVTVGAITPLIITGYTYVTGENVALMCIVGGAIIVEAIAELPLLLQVTSYKNLTIRNTCDMTSSLVRSITLIAGVVLLENVPLAFAFGQLFAAVTVLIIGARGIPLIGLVRVIQFPSWKSSEMIVMAVQKLFLAEGEKMLAVALLDPEAIGQLGLVNNIGSLVLRLVFAPIEDIAFTALAAEKRSTSDRKRILQSVFMIQSSIGLMGLAFGPQSAQAVLHILYGSEWSSSPSVVILLQFYCVLLLLFALNGSLESYYFAVGDASRIRFSLITQWVAFGALVGTAWFSLPIFGPLAILLGNAVSMMLRIGCCLTVFESVWDPVHENLQRVALQIIIGGMLSYLALWMIPEHPVFSSSALGVALTQCASVGSVAVLTLLSVRRPVVFALSSVKSS